MRIDPRTALAFLPFALGARIMAAVAQECRIGSIAAMADFEAMATFVRVVREGSFSRAAQALALPKSTVSERVARLEDRLGVRLLERTTRSLRTTTAGAQYYERCALLVAEAEEADASVADLNAEPRGLLRVACSPLFGQMVLARVAAEFVRAHPAVDIEVVATEREVSLIDEGFDLAIRTTRRDDVGLVARKLKAGNAGCVASPHYLALHGEPRRPGDLSRHSFVVFGNARKDTFRFERGAEKLAVAVTGRLAFTSLTMVKEAVLSGAGIGAMPRVLCQDDIATGRLVPLLEGWALNPTDILAVYPSARHLSPRVRLFVDRLVAYFAALETGARKD